MSIDITVVRFDGDRVGDDIVDALLSSEEAAIARGFGELNDRSVLTKIVTLETPYITGISTGVVLQAHDSHTGKSIFGRLTGIAVRGEKVKDNGHDGNPSLGMVLTLACPFLSEEG